MTASLVKVEPEKIAITPELIKRYICPNATDQELFMAASIAKSYGLNPFKREVHIIKYGSAPAQVVVGYEVYLKRADRTGKLNGWEITVAEDKQSAEIVIFRKDWDKPFKWTVYRSEFDKGQANWKSMPAFMLRKVAMGQGFRLCFPDEMGGLPYLPEEISAGTSESLPQHEPKMVEAEVVDPSVAPPPAVETQSPPPPAVPQEVEMPHSHPSSPPTAVQNVGTSQQVPTDKKDMHTLINELHQLAEIAKDAGLYPTEGAAVYEWTKYLNKKTNQMQGYKNVASLKHEWQVTSAIEKANAQLNAKPSSLDEPREDDILL